MRMTLDRKIGYSYTWLRRERSRHEHDRLKGKETEMFAMTENINRNRIDERKEDKRSCGLVSMEDEA